MRARVLVIAGICGVAAVAGRAQTKAPITHEALWLLPRVGAPATSPDGKWAVFPLTEPAYNPDDQRSDLWIVPTDGSAEPRRLTSTKTGESSPAWSPDGRRLAFVTKRDDDKSNQIYVLDVAGGGEAVRVTSVYAGAGFPAWRPDGKALLFTSPVYPNAANDADNRRIGEEREKRKFNVRTFDSFPVRRWDRWVDDRQLHVFVQDLSPARPQPICSPARAWPRTQASAPARWTPAINWTRCGHLTGRRSCSRRRPLAMPARTRTVLTDLFEVPARGGEPRQLTTRRASYSQPRFSPDGKSLFYVVADEDEQIYAHDRLGSAPWPWNGETRTITATFDRSVATWTVAGDGRSVYLTAEDEGLEKSTASRQGAGRRSWSCRPSGAFTRTSPGRRRPWSQIGARRSNHPRSSGSIRTRSVMSR